MNFKKTTLFVIVLLLMSFTRTIAAGGTARSAGSGNDHGDAVNAPSAQPVTASQNRSSGSGGVGVQTVHNKAYGDNMMEVEPGVFAIYSGDVTQDGYIASDDVVVIDNDNLGGVSGDYVVTDLTADTYVASDDVIICDNNNLAGISVQRP